MNRRQLGTAAAWVAATIVCATLAEAGEIRGQITVPPPAARAPRAHAYPGRASSLPMPAQAIAGAVWDAVVYVEKIPASAAAPPPASRPRMEQKNQSFVPRVLAVSTGTTVDFPNLDAVFHNVFSVSPPKRFDLGKYPRGKSRAVTFGQPGLVKVYCDIHSDMAAFIFIVPHGFFAQPDEAGFFSIPPLPAGGYTLRVWHPDLGEISKVVEVPSEATVSVDLAY